MNEQLYPGAIVTVATRGPQPLVVVRKEQRTAGEHPDIEITKTHATHGVRDDDAVWQCVFLPDADDDKVSNPYSTYSFPQSLLARYPVEAADRDLELPPAIDGRLETLTELLVAAREADERDSAHVEALSSMVLRAGFDLVPGMPADEAWAIADERATAAIGEGGGGGG